MARFSTDAALRAIAHPGRRRILQLVSGDERTSGELARRCRMSRPATSQHLKLLRDADLVTVRADGNRRLYRARLERLAEVLSMLDDFWGPRLGVLRAELESRKRDSR